MGYLKTGRPTKFIVSITSYFLLLTSYVLLLIFLTSSLSPAHAAVQWSLSVVEGYYMPKLGEINYILRNEEVEMGPRNVEAKPASYPVIYQGISPDDMPDIKPKTPRTGFQLQADVNPRFAVVFGGSTVVFDSSKKDVRPFFVGFTIPATRETRFSLALNQFWIGGKRYWASGKSEKTRFYAEMGMLAVTRAYLTTDVWMHVYAPEEGFDFYKVTETGAKGRGYGSYLGVGGEYFISKSLSIGMDINYTVGGVGDIRFSNYFTVDPLEKDIIKPGDKVLYTDFLTGRILQLFIDLEGWDFKGQVRFYF